MFIYNKRLCAAAWGEVAKMGETEVFVHRINSRMIHSFEAIVFIVKPLSI